MSSAQEILNAARQRTLLRQRQAGETRRCVFRLDEAHVAKQFRIPLSARGYRRPWQIEDACLRHLDGDGAPRSCGWFEETDADHRIAWLVKEYIAGEPLVSFSPADLPAAADLLAGLHRRRIITDDANPGNFIRRPDGRMAFLDFGRGRLFHRDGPWLDLHIGWELAKLRREAFLWNSALWTAFLPLYFRALDAALFRRARIRAACAASIALRMARKISKGKSPWS